MPRGLIFFLATLWLLKSALAAPELINSVAAKVGDDLITVQDAYLFRSLQRFRNGEKPPVRKETGNDLKKTIQKVMLERMILFEAKSVNFKDPQPQEASQVLKNQEAKGRGPEWKSILTAFSIKPNQLVAILQSSLFAEKFLRKKVDTLTLLVTEADIDLYIRNYPERVKKLSGDVRKLIAEALKKERTDKGLQDWIDFLTEKYSATYLLAG